MRRRLLLTALSSGAVTAVAGCTGSDGGDDEPTDSNGDSGDDTPSDDGSDGDGGDGQANFSDADTLLSFAETGDRDPPYFDADYTKEQAQYHGLQAVDTRRKLDWSTALFASFARETGS